MDERIDETDVAVMGALRTMYDTIDPVPDGLAERLKLHLTVQALHAELAELIRTPLAGVRGGDVVRTDTVTFSSPTASLMISFSDLTGNDVTVDGWVTRPDARIEVQVGDVRRSATADEHGRFSLARVPRGRAHFVIWPAPDRADERPVLTPAVDL